MDLQLQGIETIIVGVLLQNGRGRNDLGRPWIKDYTTTATPYLDHTAELCGVCCEDLGEN